jgi:hypothetical protein
LTFKRISCVIQSQEEATVAQILHPNGKPIASNDDFAEDVEWFRRMVQQVGLRLVRGSVLDDRLREVAAFAQGEEPKDESRAPELLRRVLGTVFVIRSLRFASETASWRALIGHRPWREALRSSDLGLIEIPSAPSGNDDRSFIWELVVAAIMTRFCSSVEPREPDVAALYRGVRFGVACKLIYSRNPDEQIKDVVKGAKQLEASDCEYGLVIANVTSLLDQTQFCARPIKFEAGYAARTRSEEEYRRAMLDRLMAIRSELTRGGRLDERVTTDRVNKRERPKTRSLILAAQTVCHVEWPGIFAPFGCFSAFGSYPFRLSTSIEDSFRTELARATDTVM